MTVPVPDSKLAGEARRILEALGVDAKRLQGADLAVRSPIDGRPLATLDEATVADAKAALLRHAAEAFYEVGAQAAHFVDARV